MIDIKNDNCFNYLENLKDSSIDLFLLDLPYGITNNKWDIEIDLNKMWIIIKKKIKSCGQVVFFCNTGFGYKLINSNPSWFSYDLVWIKKGSVGHLSCNKLPLRKHEMIYIFKQKRNYDKELKLNLHNRNYSKKYFSYLKNHKNITLKDIKILIGNTGYNYFYYYKCFRFILPKKEYYDLVSKNYNLESLEWFLTYEELNNFAEKNKNIYNPQKIKGKNIKAVVEKKRAISNYGENKNVKYGGEYRYPTSLLEFGYDNEKYHSTQKPVKLLEWLIKTYTNENGVVCDFTMGSGSSCIACINTNRNFYGCELEKDIFKIASERINKLIEKNKLS